MNASLTQRLRALSWNQWAPYFTFLFVFILASILGHPHFLQLQNGVNILRQISYTGMIAIGVTLVILAGGIDLSVGSAAALVGGLGILAMNHAPFSPVAGLILGAIVMIAAGGLAGWINGTLITRGRIDPIIVTLGTMAIFRSLAIYLGDAGEFRAENPLFSSMGSGWFFGLPVPVWIFLLLGATFHFLLEHMPLGRYLRATGSNAEAARYAAVPVGRIRRLSYILAGSTVGLSAWLWSSRLNSVNSSNMGLFYELDVITACVIGGTSMSGGRGSIPGTMIGVITLGMINNMLNMTGVSPYLQGSVKGSVIIIAVLLQYRKKSS